MKTAIPIGIAAGLASAVLYSSMATGSMISVLLFYLSPLPLYIAGLGWGVLSAATGIIAAAVISSLFVSAKFAGLYLVWTGGPTLGLIYLATLSRPSDDGVPKTREWYPQGRLLVWTCLIATGLLVITVVVTGPDLASFQSYMRAMFDQVIKQSTGFKELLAQQPGFDITKAVNFLIWVLPAVSVGIWALATWANIWLGAVVARASGRLERPWPPLSEIMVPHKFSWAFLACFAMSFLPGLLGLFAGAFATAAAFIFVMIGLVTLHVISRGNTFRPFILGIAYALLIFLSWLALPVFAAIGLADTSLGLRARFAGPPGPGPGTT